MCITCPRLRGITNILYSEGNNCAKRFSALQVCGLINVNGVQIDLRYHESMFNQARRPVGGRVFAQIILLHVFYDFNVIIPQTL